MSDQTPDHTTLAAHKVRNPALRDESLALLQTMHPIRFELLTLNLLGAMRYAGGDWGNPRLTRARHEAAALVQEAYLHRHRNDHAARPEPAAWLIHAIACAHDPGHKMSLSSQISRAACRCDASLQDLRFAVQARAGSGRLMTEPEPGRDFCDNAHQGLASSGGPVAPGSSGFSWHRDSARAADTGSKPARGLPTPARTWRHLKWLVCTDGL